MKPKYLYEVTAEGGRYIVTVPGGVRDLDRDLRRAGFREEDGDNAPSGTWRRSREWEGEDPDLESDYSDWEPDHSDWEPDQEDDDCACDREYSENRAWAENQENWLIPTYQLSGESN